ncbi:hypothetical protein BJX96DRAFT_182011 [Aspergillus floccosus]
MPLASCPLTNADADLENLRVPTSARDNILYAYITWAQKIVRHPTDVVFLTHIILYLLTLAPSALYLFYRFSIPHALLHWLLETYSCGPFTLMLHNHIHNDGLLHRRYLWLDMLIPYTLGPLMGHTWNSYYYHHVKHHHTENNGPEDLSSTIRYQRDSLPGFLGYLCRFLFLVWIELPVYFLRRRRYNRASKSLVSEICSIYFIFCLSRYNFHATMVTMMLPLVQTRVGMMVGNWGQHAFIERNRPTCNYRSSITLIDVQSNRHCFNDGYHTSHHQNPRRHWREHPLTFLKARNKYQSQDALVFQGIDFFLITYYLLRKDYDHLVDCLVPMGNQTKLSKLELESMLKERTRKFTAEEIPM